MANIGTFLVPIYYTPAHQEIKIGIAPDVYGVDDAFTQKVMRLDIFIWDNDVLFKRSPDGITMDPETEIPQGFYSMDAETLSFTIQNKNPGQAARYQIVGWH
jgi:hypothetical protein